MTTSEKKRWYNKVWGKVVAAMAILGVLGGIFQGTYECTKLWYEYQELRKTVANHDSAQTNYETRLTNAETYIELKKKSYQVGFRVVIITDEATGKHIKRKKHRGWTGDEHTVYKDQFWSDQEGIDYYFWIDSTGERIYCW